MDVIIKDCVEFASVAFRPNALSILLYVARQGGEAQVNNSTMQMSRQAYRTAVDHLKEAGLITSRQTQWGSIITLGPNRVVEPYSNHMSNHMITTSATTWESETRQDVVRVEGISVNGEQPHEQPHGNHMNNHIAMCDHSPNDSNLTPLNNPPIVPPRGSESLQIPYDKIVDSYHSLCPALPKVRKLTGSRKTTIRNRWKEAEGIEEFEMVFRKAQASNFLSGRSDDWTSCGFDWLMKPSNWIKVLEGNYDNPDARDIEVKQKKQEDSPEFVEWLKETYPPIYEKLQNQETIADYYRSEYTSQS